MHIRAEEGQAHLAQGGIYIGLGEFAAPIELLKRFVEFMG
jgi:hypothetical protein